MQNKKGVSGVITAVLLILLVIAAIGTLWVVVQSFVKEKTDFGGSTGCLNTQMKVVSADYVNDQVKVQRISGDAEISEVRVYMDGARSLVNPVEGQGNVLVGQLRTFQFISLNQGQVAQVAAIIGDQTCSLSEEYIIP